MNKAEILALVVLASGQRTPKDLAKALGVTYSRAIQVVKALAEEKFTVKEGPAVRLADTAHASMFQKTAARFDPVKLLADSNEAVASSLQRGSRLDEIERRTGLSYWTVRRALVDLMQIGAVAEDAEGRYELVDDEELRFFFRVLRELRLKGLAEPFAEVVFSSVKGLLKTVPLGKEAEGSPTAFSAFGRFGVELRPTRLYLVSPPRELGAEEVLVHALVFARTPIELTDCALFYAKNAPGLDPARLRASAKDFGVDGLVADLKAYVSNLTVPRLERFLPWGEFAEKGSLYGISASRLVPVPASPRLFRDLGGRVPRKSRVFVFGGEAMRVRGLKRATKDVDVVVEGRGAFRVLVPALSALGYRALGAKGISRADAELEPSGIFVKDGSPRVDLFVEKICGRLVLSDGMVGRSTCEGASKLFVCLMSNEDIFLLKSVTDREGDLYDMVELARAPGFRWGVVLEELGAQEKITGLRLCLDLLGSIEVIQDRTGIRAPIFRKLEAHCMDHGILDAVGRWGASTVQEVRAFVDYPDYRLRNRIERLVKSGRLARKEGRLRTGKNRLALTL